MDVQIRLNPTIPKVRLWNKTISSHDTMMPKTIHLPIPEQTAWRNNCAKRQQQKGHEARYEQMERARLWRYLSGDNNFDVDYYYTRMEGRAHRQRNSE